MNGSSRSRRKRPKHPLRAFSIVRLGCKAGLAGTRDGINDHLGDAASGLKTGSN